MNDRCHGWITVNSLEHKLKRALIPGGTRSSPRSDYTGEDVAQVPGGPGDEVLGNRQTGHECPPVSESGHWRPVPSSRAVAPVAALLRVRGGVGGCTPGRNPLVAHVVAPMGRGHCGGGPPFRSVKVSCPGPYVNRGCSTELAPGPLSPEAPGRSPWISRHILLDFFSHKEASLC